MTRAGVRGSRSYREIVDTCHMIVQRCQMHSVAAVPETHGLVDADRNQCAGIQVAKGKYRRRNLPSRSRRQTSLYPVSKY